MVEFSNLMGYQTGFQFLQILKMSVSIFSFLLTMFCSVPTCKNFQISLGLTRKNFLRYKNMIRLTVYNVITSNENT